jgi:phosphatidylglycerophosphatase A
MSPGLARAIATFGYVGLIPGAPGTWGSLAALPAGYALHWLGGFPLLALATLAVFALGLRATAAATRAGGHHDPSEIVIDEVAGQWIALMPLSLGLWLAGAAPHVFPWPGWVGAFVLFRAFDILKPWPVSWADRRADALGVMLDDVVAGVMAAAVVTLLAAVAHGWLA